ncbi:hypothetical protein EV664_10469 [Stakelama pacifica]|uniref:Uncharacterized protein n=2 Tax=Stakelama pacifica TaxID=517720 RepID=A0A4R6FPJ7_9SPHN|nr:hypothetical protein EV664_10469 [Stakelama pacifica]GGO94248.1 hypothetical protein GCM10011329_15580 [Stakelama pacifica]
MLLPNRRSPDFLLVIAGALFGVGLAARFAFGEGPVAWVLLICAFPPAFEAELVRRSGQIGAMIYSRDQDEISSLTYDRSGAILRCVFMTIVLGSTYLFGRGGYNLIPDSVWAVPLLVGPVIAYVIWGGWSYRRRIVAAARSGSWSKRRPR